MVRFRTKKYGFLSIDSQSMIYLGSRIIVRLQTFFQLGDFWDGGSTITASVWSDTSSEFPALLPADNKRIADLNEPLRYGHYNSTRCADLCQVSLRE